MTVVNNVFQKCFAVMSTKRGESESYCCFEQRFDAKFRRFNAITNADVLPESLCSFLLLAYARIESNQRVSILVAVSPRLSEVNGVKIEDSVQ